MANPRRETAKTNGTLAVTTGSTLGVPYNPSRLYLRITNPDAAGILYLKFSTVSGKNLGDKPVDPVATADTASTKIAPGAFFETTVFTGSIAVIGSAGFNVNVLEI